MAILITGAAGFIGFHTAKLLLARGETVIGVDNLNDYYDPALKQARLERLMSLPGFVFHKADIADREAMEQIAHDHPDVTGVVNLAAQAGVRHSLKDPYSYTHANIEGFLVILELCRHRWPDFKHLVYASSSSVYGANTKLPFSVDDRVDTPISLYAATKKANELMGHCYSHLYRIPATGLRFFTVYGPWGRPDMAAYIFTSKIMAGEKIPVFNNGDMKRDFTYIDDIVAGVVGCLDNPPADGGTEAGAAGVPHRVYNIGNNRSEKLTRYIELIEQALGKKADVELLPMQPGDVRETYADIDAISRDIGYAPTTPIDEGIPKFVAWYKDFHGVA